MALTRIIKVKANNSFGSQFLEEHNRTFTRIRISLTFAHSQGICSVPSKLMRHVLMKCPPCQWHGVNFSVAPWSPSGKDDRISIFYVLTQTMARCPEMIPHGRVHEDKSGER